MYFNLLQALCMVIILKSVAWSNSKTFLCVKQILNVIIVNKTPQVSL